MRYTLTATAVVIALAAAGCSSGSGPTAAEREYAAATPDKPRGGWDFEKTCAEGLGFPGLTGYQKTAGQIHPVAIANKLTSGWSVSSPGGDDIPKDWLIDVVSGADKAQLVACVEETGQTSTGKVCDMQDRKSGEKTKVTMYSVDYKVRVMEARTGTVVGEHTATKKEDDCPVLTFWSEGDDRSRYVPNVMSGELKPILAPYVAP
jgi:hypothetical protein